MEDKIKLLIVDDNVEFATMLSQYASTKKSVDSVLVAHDGIEAISLVEQFKPDVVILDIIMPQLDGIGVLEYFANIKDDKKPSFIVLSAIGQDNNVKRAMNLGASYYMVKPFDVDVLMSRIYELHTDRISTIHNTSGGCLAEKISTEIIEADIIRILHRLAIPPNLSGYRFLKEAIKLSVKDENIFKSVTKMLYPKTAEICSSSAQKVERSIRNAIDCAWKNGKNVYREQLFGYIDGKPSNSQFISTIAEGIRTGKL